MSSQIYKVSTQDLPDDQTDIDLDAAIQDAEAAPVIALVNKVLVKALKRRFQIFTLNRKKNICGFGFARMECCTSPSTLCLRKSFQP